MPVQRVRIEVEGTVQGVGFRPFVYRLAKELELAGWVHNTMNGVVIEVEGEAPAVETFLQRLRADTPPAACLDRMSRRVMPVLDETDFAICPSSESGQRALVVPPDLATCADCLRELCDQSDRRFRYPFLTC
ncbi:MAG: acylphosphatase, partial [Nitrospira sp.]|nr:acylphosphatase [Nitrospira sp.]